MGRPEGPEGQVAYVPFTAPGDRAVVEAAPSEGALHATLVELAAPGAARVPPPCSHFGVRAPGTPPPPLPGRDALCGGCEWLHVRYEEQLRVKARTVREALRRIGRLEPGTYEERPILGSPAPLRYRVRAKFHLNRPSRRLVFFQRRSHAPVRLEECHLLVPGLDALRAGVGPALVEAGLAATEVSLEWSEQEGRGAAHAKVADTGASARKRAEALLALVPALSGVVLTAEGQPPAVVGDPVLRHPRDPGHPAAGLQRSRPDVFLQANRGANALLVAEALAMLAPGPQDAVLELFCGAGNFTSPLAARARSVSAIEVAGPSLELARADLGPAGAGGGPAAGNVRFFAGDALKLGAALGRERGPDAPRFRLALLDPPREGAKGVGPLLRDLAVERAVYVSCDPATLARDLNACTRAGFRVASVRAVDMFPQTHHVEAVALLVRG
ncbi:MAG: class I SAM-dependent RNA methyltransferase [Anaeromyxobacteraceae bacterium]